jgi:hypothetical protein
MLVTTIRPSWKCCGKCDNGSVGVCTGDNDKLDIVKHLGHLVDVAMKSLVEQCRWLDTFDLLNIAMLVGSYRIRRDFKIYLHNLYASRYACK